jgi:hypothetical protein
MKIDYTPPPTVRDFIKDYRPGELFYDWIVGPVGSGKTTGIFFKLCYMAGLQAPGPDGIRRSRAVIVRNTLPQLRDTTLSSWNYWFKPGQAGEWKATEWKFILKFADVECEVLFRPLDTEQDVARVLSLEVTFAIIDEFVQVPRSIIDALSARCGRYPSAVMGGATNWGIWGSSNPSTEDNWWFDYLHDPTICIQPGTPLPAIPLSDNAAVREAAKALGGDGEPVNARYFLQPSGFSEEAENVENLPGGREYYTNQAKGKSEAWVKQFLEAEWGFSIAGKPVVPTFKPDLHLSKKRLIYNPHLPLVGGFDPGIGGAAMIIGQEDIDGRLLALGEVVTQGVGASRFVTEKLNPYLRRHFPELDPLDFVVAPDPAAGNRTGADEKTVVDIIKKFYKVSIESNNRLPLRLDAIEHFTTRLVDGRPALLIDAEMCPILVRALKGGWRYKLDKHEQVMGKEPEKNSFSHPGDGFGYLCRFFHRQATRNERYVSAGRPPRQVAGMRYGARAYHAR